jgi:hypothetical protein
MAVTVTGKTIVLTAQGDQWDNPIIIKSIHWIGATTAGHLLEIKESPVLETGTPGTIYKDEAAGANYVSRALIEKYYHNGFEITDLDSGAVHVIYS